MRPVGVWLLAGACTDAGTGPVPTDDAGRCPETLEVTLGTGLDAYLALADGDPAQMVHGPQGGWHIDSAGLVTGPSIQVAITPSLHLGDRQIAGDQQPWFTALAAWDAESCSGEFWGVRAYIDDEVTGLPPGTDVLQDYICPLAGQSLRFSVVVEDLDSGVTSTDEVTVRVLLDPYDVNACAAGA